VGSHMSVAPRFQSRPCRSIIRNAAAGAAAFAAVRPCNQVRFSAFCQTIEAQIRRYSEVAMAALVGTMGSEAAAWRKLADNMRHRASVARPGTGKDLLNRLADQFEKATQRATGGEADPAFAAQDRHQVRAEQR
jgi:hypothetical protein